MTVRSARPDELFGPGLEEKVSVLRRGLTISLLVLLAAQPAAAITWRDDLPELTFLNLATDS